MSVQNIMAIIDKNKTNMSDSDYLDICNDLMKLNEKTTTYTITYFQISYFTKLEGNRMVVERFTEKKTNTNITEIDSVFSYDEYKARLEHFGIIPITICNNKIKTGDSASQKSRTISEDEDTEYATHISIKYDEYLLLKIEKN